VKVVLDTHSFQAPDFYRALGYDAVGTTCNTPVGFTDTIFEKSLTTPPGAQPRRQCGPDRERS
jgi:hypothetical protein